MKNVLQLLMNHETERIVQYISRNGMVTAKQICETLTDISKATIYRKLKALEENKIINVVTETKVRGAVEKTYAINDAFIATFNTIDRAEENIYSFIAHLFAEFSKYFQDSNADPLADKLFLQNYNILLSDDECEAFQEEIPLLFWRKSILIQLMHHIREWKS